MPKHSTVTARETPVNRTAAAAAGALTIRAETFVVETAQRIETHDLTERVERLVRCLEVREGLVHLWSMHTTCAVFMSEWQAALQADIVSFLEQMVDRRHPWLHNDPAHSDCDRANADSHLRALMLGHGLTLQISGGEVVLGQYQRILMAELDGPRTRTIRVQVWGIA